MSGCLFNVLIPEDYKEGEKRPCVIACHGHGSGGKLATSGRDGGRRNGEINKSCPGKESQR